MTNRRLCAFVKPSGFGSAFDWPALLVAKHEDDCKHGHPHSAKKYITPFTIIILLALITYSNKESGL